MLPDDGNCTCVGDIEQQHLVDTYAEHVVCEFVDSFGAVCPAMMDFIIERILARLVHVAVWNYDNNLEHSERKTLDATADYIFRLSKTAPAALKIIMDDAARKKEPANARN